MFARTSIVYAAASMAAAHNRRDEGRSRNCGDGSGDAGQMLSVMWAWGVGRGKGKDKGGVDLGRPAELVKKEDWARVRGVRRTRLSAAVGSLICSTMNCIVWTAFRYKTSIPD